MAAGGFELRSWFSNSPKLNDKFQVDCKNTSHDSELEKILGYNYSPVSDTLKLTNLDLDKNYEFTKRSVLALVSRVFDPLGLYNPVTIRGRIFIQKLWRAKVTWDEPLSSSYKQEWDSITSDLSSLSEINFPRHVISSSVNNILVLFCDSSKSAYGFAAYGVHESSSVLLYSKAKVAPNKAKSLPTLELLAIFLAMKCLSLILNVKSLSITECFICSDSVVALSWVLNKEVKSKNQFASNRVKDICVLHDRLISDFKIKLQFKYIPTLENPGDLITRGLTFNNFSSKFCFWNNGPSFLNNFPIKWPVSPSGSVPELSSTVVACNVNKAFSSGPLFPINKYSSIDKMFRITALIMQFCNSSRKVPVDRLQLRLDASFFWIRYSQGINFSSEIDFLRNPAGSQIPNLVRNLNLFLDEENILRSKGRLDKCKFASFDIANPIVLHRDCHFTKLLVVKFHEKCRHLGLTPTLNSLRNSGYWIPKARPLIKRLLNSCVPCKKINSYSFKYPKRTDYVSDKVNFISPFAHTGVDFTGHFFVKNGETVAKYYLLIFTCLNIRAVHLELVPSMNTTQFLLAFVKFCNIHCVPKSLYSDNASTFLHAAKILSNSDLDCPLNEYLIKNSIKHIRIPLYSAWVGNAWERLLRVVKGCLFKSIGRKKLEFFEFSSLLTDIQNVINNRPLTYRDSDPNNIDVITPNSFLKTGLVKEITFGRVSGMELQLPNRKELVSALNRREDVFDHFKTVWYEQYLISLRESSRDVYESHWVDRIKVGDIVLLYSPIKSRPHWPLGIVTELLTGSDNKTRCVRVRRADGSQDVHSINLLYPLELSLLSTDNAEINNPDPAIGKDGSASPTAAASAAQRPRRAAAEQCLKKLKDM